MPRGRPTSAATCREEVPVLLAGRPVVVICGKAYGHGGEHRGPVTWPRRIAPPPTR